MTMNDETKSIEFMSKFHSTQFLYNYMVQILHINGFKEKESEPYKFKLEIFQLYSNIMMNLMLVGSSSSNDLQHYSRHQH